MNRFFNKKNLFIRIAVGFVFGVLLGLVVPRLSLEMKFLGDIYLNLIRMMIVPVIFVSVATGILNMNSSKELGRVSFKSVGLFLFNLITSSILAIYVAKLFNPGSQIVLDNMTAFNGKLASTSIADFFSSIVPSNIIKAMADGNILAVILFTVLFATSAVFVGKPAQPVKELVNSLASVVFKILDVVMSFSPIGVGALMAFTTAQYGSGVFSALGKYILTIYVTSAVIFVVILVIPMVLYTKINPIFFFKKIYPIVLMTVSTTSSAATLPTSLKVSEDDLKVPAEISRFVLPLGNTIQMVGGSVSFSCLAIFVSGFYGIELTVEQLVFCTFVSTLLNMGAPGIPGGGIVLGATFLSIVGLPFELMGPIAAIYRLLDMVLTTLNTLGDVTANVMIAKSEKIWSVDRLEKE